MVSLRRVGAAVTLALAAGGAAGFPAAAATPTANVAMPVDFVSACAGDPASPTCVAAALADIDYARSLEGVRPMLLPDDFATLDAGRQAFVVTNLERVDRGLRPLVGLTADLDTLATAAAAGGTDPVFTGSMVGPMQGLWWTGVWAHAPNPLVADLLWMYADGYAGTDTTNIDCPSADSPGCWGHRANILSDYAGAPEVVAGVGSSDDGRSVAVLAVGGTGALPPLSYAWADALRHGAGGHAVSASGSAPTVVARAVVAVHPGKHSKQWWRRHRRWLLTHDG